MMKRRLLAVALLSVGAACSHFARSAEPEPQDQVTTVKVENQNFQDMNVYVLGSGGERVRLGLVTSLSTQVFTIPADIVRMSPQIRFLLHPIGARRNPISETITVMPGDHVELTIPPLYETTQVVPA